MATLKSCKVLGRKETLCSSILRNGLLCAACEEALMLTLAISCSPRFLSSSLFHSHKASKLWFLSVIYWVYPANDCLLRNWTHLFKANNQRYIAMQLPDSNGNVLSFQAAAKFAPIMDRIFEDLVHRQAISCLEGYMHNGLFILWQIVENYPC